MHHALTTEIVRLILSSGVSLSTTRDVALTCRLWKDPALDRLWKHLDSVFPLLWVLAPLRAQAARGTTITWALDVAFPLPENWERFEMYARRVRTLAFDLSPPNGNSFDLTTFQTIAQYRPPGKEVLPNLRKFTFNARRSSSLSNALSSFLIFLGSSIVELELLQIAPGGIPSFLAYVAQRAPQVQDLKIGGRRSSEMDSNALAICLSRLEKLQSLNTPSIRLTPAVWDAMAQHTRLTYASFPAQAWGHLPATMDFQPRAFAKLERLVIRESFDFLCSLFEPQNVLPKITRIVAEGGPTGQGRNEFRRLCELLARKLPNLEFVWLGCHSNAVHEEGPLQFGDFKPLLQCKNIRYFHLAHPCGVALTVGEVAQVLDAWPRIKSLALQYASYNMDARGTTHGIKWTPPTLPLSVLDVVAEKAPKVKDLSLILDATAPLSGAMSKPGQYQFECLDELAVSLSTASQPGAVAGYLAQRSRKRFSLKFELPENLQGNTRPRLGEEKNRWNQIAENLGLLYDQKERLEEEFGLRMREEQARHVRELREVMDSSLSLSQHK